MMPRAARLDRVRHVTVPHQANVRIGERLGGWGTGLAGGSILDGAPSAELAALLEGIADISFDSQPKFSPGTVKALERLICGRAYGPPMLELCHLLRVAALAPRRKFERFFWGVSLARAGAYAGWVQRALRASPAGQQSPLIEPERGGVAIVYPDGRFAISYGRMPLLAALMEFLVSSLGFAAVQERFAALLARPPAATAIGEMANELSRTVYAWLVPHLPTAHENRRLEAMVGWLNARHAPNGFSTEDIDDDAVLAFWLAAREDEFRTFESVLRGFLLLADAMEDAAVAIGLVRAARLGTDADAGEMEPQPDDVAGTARNRVLHPDQADAGIDPLAALAEPPADRVKLLNQRERLDLEQIFQAGLRGERMMLSLLRWAVFGAVQKRISEALRRDGLAGAARLLSGLNRGVDVPAGYAEWQARYDELAEHLDRVMLASLHVLAQASNLAALHLLVELGEGADLGGLREADGSVDPARLGARLQDPAVAGPRIAALMTRAHRSFAKISRAGFEKGAPDDAAIVAGHAVAAPHLPRLGARLARMRAALSRRTPEAWAAQQKQDHALFTARFAEIYQILIQETSP
jgi:hypothetical protein